MKQVICARRVLDEFTTLVHDHTVNNLETLGILFGEIKEDDEIYISHLLVPGQVGQSDSCEITEEGCQDLSSFAEHYNVVQIGWIHTHPQWDVFMSSVDLHTQYSLQKDLPEAVAIVVNPTQNIGAPQPCYGAYHLTPQGMAEISKCSSVGFHHHQSSENLYQSAMHLQVQEKVAERFPVLLASVSNKLKMYIDFDIRKSWPWKRLNYGRLIPISTTETLPVPLVKPVPIVPVASAKPVPETEPSDSVEKSYNTSPASSRVDPISVKEHDVSFVPPPPTSRPELLNSHGQTILVTADSSSNRPSTSTAYVGDHDYDNDAPDIVARAYRAFQSCQEYIEAESLCAKAVVEEACFKESICKLENSLVTLCSTGLADGVLYAVTFAIDDRYIYTRYIDFGVMQGAFSLLQEVTSSTQSLPRIEWKVLTKTDFVEKKKVYFDNLSKKREERKLSSKDLPDTGRRWHDVVSKGSKSLRKSYNCLLNSSSSGRVELLGTCVQVLKTEKTTKLGVHGDTDIHYQSGIFSSNDIVRQCQHFRLHGQQMQEDSFIEQLSAHSFETMSLMKQGDLVNSVSNDSTPSGRGGIVYSQYFSCGGEPSFKPTSLRNLLLYHYFRHERNKFHNVVEKVMGSNIAVQRKRRKPEQFSSRTKRIRGEEHAGSDAPTMPDVESFAVDNSCPPRSPYEEFATTIVEKGTLQWRNHTADEDCFVFNTIDLNTGIFQANKFCHLRIWHQPSLKCACDCQIFCLLARSGTDSSEIECCHVRFFKELIQPVLNLALTEPDKLPATPIGIKVRQSLHTMNSAVVQADNSVGKRFHTFSVMTDPALECAFVTLEGSRFRCWKGVCRARKGHTRKTSQLSNANTTLCQHLGSIHSHQELWSHLVLGDTPIEASTASDGGEEEEEENVLPNPTDSAARDEEEENATDHSMIYFDEATGLWKSNSISSHPPRAIDDPILQNAIQERLSINKLHPDYGVDEHGYLMKKSPEGLKSFDLFPKLDKDLICQCGGKYWNSDHPNGLLVPRWKQPLTIYLLHGAAKYLVHSRDCLNRRVECRRLYSGADDGIHILSSHTAAGDELGWEFMNMVMNSQSSITCFVQMKVSSYYGSRVSFKSRQTFTNWIFSWLVNFGTDFRKRCSACGENPAVLAGDGTKLGIFFRHSNVSPLEKPDCDDVQKPLHKRNNRQFFSYSTSDPKEEKKEKITARHCLMFFVAKNSDKMEHFQKTASFKCISGMSDEEKKQAVLSNVASQLQEFFSKYIDGSLDQAFLQAVNPIFLVFSSEAPLSALINKRFLSLLSDIVCNPTSASVLSIHDDLPEIYGLFHTAFSLNDESLQYVVAVLRHCIEEIKKVHKDDKEPEATDGVPVVKLYNPVKQGAAYYFTRHGGQMRLMPKYDINDDRNKDSSCNKNFPQAAKSGTTYLFLMFDPLHYGHCYGFHVITTSEGRKDAFAPPYLYMEKAPDEMFYDFSCQLEEYCLNREPKFWSHTRFWHDIFHGYSHKCPFVYSSRRVRYLNQHNTEICEQFNAYIQKIKYSARAMSQTHFIFYLQFFIDQWNQRKQAAYEKQLLTVRSLSL